MAPTTAQKLLAAYNGFYGKDEKERTLFFSRFVMNRDTILFFLICITPLRIQFDVLFSLYSLTTKTKQA